MYEPTERPTNGSKPMNAGIPAMPLLTKELPDVLLLNMGRGFGEAVRDENVRTLLVPNWSVFRLSRFAPPLGSFGRPQ